MICLKKFNKVSLVFLILVMSVGCAKAQQDSDSRIINVDDELTSYAESTGGIWHSEIQKMSYFRTGQFDEEMLSLLPITTLNAIEKILIGYIRLDKIPDFTNLPELIYLHLSNNEISDLSPLRGLNLTDIIISENPFTDITPLSKIKTLEDATLGSSLIIGLPNLSEWINMKSLGFSDSTIENLDNLETIPSDFDLYLFECNQLVNVDALLEARVNTLFIDELNYERLQPWFDENVEKIKEKRPQFNIRFSAGE